MFFNLLKIIIFLAPVVSHANSTEGGVACKKVEDQLGQLFYVNVDGFQTKDVISPIYFQMIKDLKIGGVLPHFNWEAPGFSVAGMREATARLQKATELPLLIGVDHAIFPQKKGHPVYGSPVPIGLGAAEGALGKVNQISSACAGKLAFLEAFLHRAIGLNQALGPTIEKKGQTFLSASDSEFNRYAGEYFDAFNGLGVATTMKHYPYTPDSYDLHEKSEDTKIPRKQVMNMLERFRANGSKSTFVMSTHVINSNIDSEDMATFSKKWIDILRNEIGFKGLLITDGLFMMDKYEKTVQLQLVDRWPIADSRIGSNKQAIFAARAILAGHDQVILEGTAEQTKKTFRDLHYLACQNSPLAKELRSRIFESYERIKAFKQTNLQSLRPNVKIPDEIVNSAFQEYTKIFEARNCSMFNMYRGYCTKVDTQYDKVDSAGIDKACEVDAEFTKLKNQISALGFGSYAVTGGSPQAHPGRK